MLAVRCHRWMPYQQLELEDVPVPIPGPGQVRIAVHYAGMSFATSLVTEGRYQRKPPLPFSPVIEIAGMVDAVASDVTYLKPGDRVCAGIDWGGHAETRLPMRPRFTAFRTTFRSMSRRKFHCPTAHPTPR